MRFHDSLAFCRACGVFTLLSVATLGLTACSATPDRYAFWRNDAATADTGAQKPNLGDIPATPDVEKARQDMRDMQDQLTTDRDAALHLTQHNPARQSALPMMAAPPPAPVIAAVQPVAPTAINSPVMNPPAPAFAAAVPVPSRAPVSFSADAAALRAPSVPTPPPAMPPVIPPSNTLAAGPGAWPVYVPPSVQINPIVPNPPLRPYASLQPAPDYAYGRSEIQTRQAANIAAPPAAIAESDSVTVDFSALGMPDGLYADNADTSLRTAGINGMLSAGAPAIFFHHGSTRLSDTDRRTLASLAANAGRRPRAVRVIGHASSRTAARSTARAHAVNLKISATRAALVADELARKGVDPVSIEATAVGDRDAAQAPSESAARRVDVLIDP